VKVLRAITNAACTDKECTECTDKECRMQNAECKTQNALLRNAACTFSNPECVTGKRLRAIVIPQDGKYLVKSLCLRSVISDIPQVSKYLVKLLT
jgi:hypothetical protein